MFWIILAETSETPLYSINVFDAVFELETLDQGAENDIFSRTKFANHRDCHLSFARVTVNELSRGRPLKLERILQVRHLLIELLLQNKRIQRRELRSVIILGGHRLMKRIFKLLQLGELVLNMVDSGVADFSLSKRLLLSQVPQQIWFDLLAEL